MTYGSILVYVESGSTPSESRIDIASALARRLNATLIGLAAQAVHPPMVDPFGGAVLVGEMVAAEEDQIRSELVAAERKFRLHPGLQEPAYEWRAYVDLPAQVLAREARSADLIIVGRGPDRVGRDMYRAPDPGEVIMAAGRPVLVVPPGVGGLEARHIVVAWKDTREARRAVWDALPLLRAAETVHAVEVADPAELQAATARIADVVRHLERHQVKAHGQIRAQREASAADEVISVAEQHGADLIVAGAYGHSRIREWVFGGVTRDLLTHCAKCCLFSH
jgi:nucleotide-binding universal stress UspA family protein